MCLSGFPVVTRLCLDVYYYVIGQHFLTVGVFVFLLICERYVPVGHGKCCVGSYRAVGKGSLYAHPRAIDNVDFRLSELCVCECTCVP